MIREYLDEQGWQTFGDVAVSLDVGGDVRDVVDRLAEFNGTDQLVPGQVVEIPSDLAA